MSTADTASAERRPTTSLERGLILAAVTLASTLYATTILVVSVILPEMQGSLSATQDQIAWAMTLNILATAIVTPMTGWLVARFGRRGVMLWSLVGFTVSTFLCGIADSLEALVIFRVAQGAFGAPMVPLGQTVVLDTFPGEKRGFATAVFGMGVVIGPVIGPVLGGVLAEMYNWRWAFFMIIPVAILALVGLWFTIVDADKQTNPRLDWTGFLALSVAVTCMQLMLDRGNRLDWFEATEIVLYTAFGLIAFYIFLAHSLTTRRPFLDLRHLLDRNYAVGLVLVTIYGMLNFTPMVLFPPMLQGLLGFPNSVIGELIAARGAGAVVGFFAAMWVSRMDPRVGMVIGMVLQAASGVHMMTFGPDTTFTDLAIAGLVQGAAVGLFWVPLTIATFSTIAPGDLAETSATFHLLRNLGSSVFISLSVTTVIRTGNQSYAVMTELVNPYNEALKGDLGPWSIDSTSGLAALSAEIARQAQLIGYLDAFALYTAACIASIPLILLFKIRPR